jgi:hypothetical protein
LFHAGATVKTVKEGDCWSVLVVTPIMKRIQGTTLAKEVTYVDSTGHLDASLAHLTLLTSVTKAGGMPLAALITCRQTTANYKQAFSLFKKNFPLAFGGNDVRINL